VAERTVGFDEFADYVTGADGGVAKTTAWAAEITAVPARTIEALAQEWAAKRTTVHGCGMGGACRTAYGHEYARLIVCLQAMQGLGKPGINLWGNSTGAPADYSVLFPGYADLDAMMSFSRAARKKAINPVEQRLYRILLPDSFLNPPVHWMGEGFCGQRLEQQFAEFLTHHVTPAFPAGMTVYDAYGQMQHTSGEIIKQKTKVVLLVHKNSKADDEAINKIIATYRDKFGNPQVMLLSRKVTPVFFPD